MGCADANRNLHPPHTGCGGGFALQTHALRGGTNSLVVQVGVGWVVGGFMCRGWSWHYLACSPTDSALLWLVWSTRKYKLDQYDVRSGLFEFGGMSDRKER
jgi:hypothetical protein